MKVDKVAMLDDNDNLEFVEPIDYYEYEHVGKMVHIKNRQVDILCTLNHKLYVSDRKGGEYNLEFAKDLLGKMCLWDGIQSFFWRQNSK